MLQPTPTLRAGSTARLFALLALAAHANAVDAPDNDEVILGASAQAIAELGQNKRPPIDRGFFFLHDQYLPAPYVLERRGAALFINNQYLGGSEWPPYDYKVDQDPGEPPPGTSPFDEAPPGQDGRNSYWSRKARYLTQHHDPRFTQQEYARLLSRAKDVAQVVADPIDPGQITVVTPSGRKRELTLRSDRQRAPQSKPPDPKALVGSLENALADADRELTSDSVCLASYRHILRVERGIRFLEVLSSAMAPAEKVSLLTMERLIDPDVGMDELILRYVPHPDLSGRFAKLAAQRKNNPAPRPADASAPQDEGKTVSVLPGASPASNTRSPRAPVDRTNPPATATPIPALANPSLQQPTLPNVQAGPSVLESSTAEPPQPSSWSWGKLALITAALGCLLLLLVIGYRAAIRK